MAKKTTKTNLPMVKVTLEKIATDLPLPEKANNDFTSFAGAMNLFDYQKNAITKASKILCRYFADRELGIAGNDYLLDSYKRYSDYPLDNLSVKSDDALFSLLSDYFTSNDGILDYSQFLNRMNFWMATGSGKTIVMIKLIAIISELMRDGLIPIKPIMILAPDDNILAQIINSVDKYNLYADHKLNLVDLKQNWERDNSYASAYDLFGQSSTKVYFYKSNNFVADKSEVAKDKDGKNIYFDNYRNTNGWYLFLDEAHRGEDNKSRRKAIFNILAQNGFLFNFSATFTDDIDILTTVFDMNLAKFLQSGYGKKLYISETEIGDLANGINENLLIDNKDIEKQKTIAKTVLLLALQRKNAHRIKNICSDLYHMPLMLVLAGKVNSEDQGLKPFFNYLIKMVKNEWNIDDAKNELKRELNRNDGNTHTNFKFGLGDTAQINVICEQLDLITNDDIWQYVFGGGQGNIEVITFEKNKNEIAFQLKTADKPFALLVIGEALNWLKNDTSGVFDIATRGIDASLFDTINYQDNIAMLLGSQMFKEGWDSNRPNIVCYLGIGKNSENKKYVMQTIGRGIRIEPLKGQRQRFEFCDSASIVTDEIDEIRQLVPVLETEFVFATDSKAINEIWSIIQEQGSKEKWSETLHVLFKINKTLPRELILPRYKNGVKLNNNPFRTSVENRRNLIDDIKFKTDKTLVLQHNINLRTLQKLRGDKSVISASGDKLGSSTLYTTDYLIKSIHEHFNKREKVIAEFVHLSDQIKHYQHISTTLTNGELEQLERELKQLMMDDTNLIDEDILLKRLLSEKITKEEYAKQLTITKEHKNKLIDYKIIKIVNGIKKLFKHHYYQPLTLFNEQYHDKFKHIIKVTSEIDFLCELCKNQSILDEKYDWWYFTKVDESLDVEIGIDYFDANIGKTRKFYPDFIFWLKEKITGKLIVKFVDPKGGEHQHNPYDKAVGFENMFIHNIGAKAKEIQKKDNYQFELCFYNQDELMVRTLSDGYKKYWYNSLKQIFDN